MYRKRAVPYFLALISHSLLGDFFIGGQLQLFWPFSSDSYGVQQIGSYYLSIYSAVNIALEVTLFVAAMLTLYKTKDWKIFFRSEKTNLLLVIPIITVLLPSTIGYPFTNPLIFSQPTLAVAHICYLVLFSIAVSKTLLTLHLSKFKKKVDKTDSKLDDRNNLVRFNKRRAQPREVATSLFAFYHILKNRFEFSVFCLDFFFAEGFALLIYFFDDFSVAYTFRG